MVELDMYWLVSESLVVVTAIAFIITQFLMPSRRKIEEEGATVPIWIGAIILGMISVAIAGVIIALFLVEKNLFILVTGGILILALVMGMGDFILSRRKATAVHMTEGDLHYAGNISPQGISHDQHPHFQHHYHDHQNLPTPGHELPQNQQQALAPAAGTMTVECPQCGSHIHMPEGSHQITCPYCGLSGTL